MFSTRPLISKSSSTCANLFVTVPRAPITMGIMLTFMFHSFFNPLACLRYLSLLSHSFNFTLQFAGTAILQTLFFVDYYQICLSAGDFVIRLSLEIPEEFVRLILKYRFLVVYIPFVRMVKHQFLAQFPADHLVHPAVPSIIFSL